MFFDDLKLGMTVDVAEECNISDCKMQNLVTIIPKNFRIFR